jgi:hypothetical protein
LAVLCSECGGSRRRRQGCARTLRPARPKCRSKRSRRLKRAQEAERARRGRYPPHAKEARSTSTRTATAQTVRDVAHKLLEDELRPVVREAITEDALKAIRSMVGLTPRVIELLAEDMESDDARTPARVHADREVHARASGDRHARVRRRRPAAGRQLRAPPPRRTPRRAHARRTARARGRSAEETQQCETCGASSSRSTSSSRLRSAALSATRACSAEVARKVRRPRDPGHVRVRGGGQLRVPPLPVHTAFHVDVATSARCSARWDRARVTRSCAEAIAWCLEQPGIRGVIARKSIARPARHDRGGLLRPAPARALQGRRARAAAAATSREFTFPNGSTVLFRRWTTT